MEKLSTDNIEKLNAYVRDKQHKDPTLLFLKNTQPSK